jgi:subtilisin family serine protease
MPDTLDSRLAWRLQDYLERRTRPPIGSDVDAEGQEVLTVLVRFRGSIERLEAAGFVPRRVREGSASGTLRLADLQRLSEVPELIYAESSRRLSPSLDRSVPEIRADLVRKAVPAYTGLNTVVGIVDSGVDIFHHNLRRPNGTTRILRLWDQTVDPFGAFTSPAGFTEGVELRAAAINAALSAGTPFASQDTGHGTHVASIAAGDGSQSGNCHFADHYIGVAPHASLIVVKTTFDVDDVVDGVDYVFRNTPAANGAVVNLSLTADSGAHDGLSWMDTEMNGLVAGTTGRVIVAASGNAAGSRHARKPILHGTTETISFDIGSNDVFSDEFEMWYAGAARLDIQIEAPSGARTPWFATGATPVAPQTLDGSDIQFESQLNVPLHAMHRIWFRLPPPAGAPIANGRWIIRLRETTGTDDTVVDCWIDHSQRAFAEAAVAASGTADFEFAIRNDMKRTEECEITYNGDPRLDIVVTTPGGDRSPVVTAGTRPIPPPVVAGHTLEINSRVNETPGHHRITFVIRRDPGLLTSKDVKTGTWRIRLTETAARAGRVECRLPADRFSYPFMIRADRNAGTSIGSPAAADNVIAVGSYDYRNGDLADSSGRGPRLGPAPPDKPDVVAPGVQIMSAKTAARGTLLCSDCCDDFYIAFSGTSMAAPHVAGVVACMLQKRPGLTFTEVRDHLRASARHTPGPPAPNYNTEWGYGKVDADAAVRRFVAAAPPPALPLIFIPIALSAWQLYDPVLNRLRDLQVALAPIPAGQLLAALVSKHFDEVARLIRTVRRVAAAWRMTAGPQIVRTVLDWNPESGLLLPAEIADRPLRPGFERILRELLRVGSPTLRQDIALYQPFVLALPGASLTDLPSLLPVPHGGPAGYARARRA